MPPRINRGDSGDLARVINRAVENDVASNNATSDGPIAKSIVKIDGWIGQILDQIDELGIRENTMVMGDNGPFMQYVDRSGQSDRIYRGGKAQHLEGGVRVNVFMRWPAVLKPGSRVSCLQSVPR